MLIRSGELHDDVHTICNVCAVPFGAGDVTPQLSAVRELVPFTPGFECWSS